MIVKVGNTYYDSNDMPIMIILTDEEKKLISEMGKQRKFCSFPPTISEEKIVKFMETPNL